MACSFASRSASARRLITNEAPREKAVPHQPPGWAVVILAFWQRRRDHAPTKPRPL